MAAVASVPSAAMAQAIDEAPTRRADRMLEALADVSGVPGLGAVVWRDGAVAWGGQAALVTPVGLYDLRTAGGSTWISNMARGDPRRLEISLD